MCSPGSQRLKVFVAFQAVLEEEGQAIPDRAHFKDVGGLVTLLLHPASVGVA